MYETLTDFRRDILFVVAGYEQTADGAPHGIAIMEDLESYRDEEVNHGRLYPNLDGMVDDGLLLKGERDKRTNYYHLTQRGLDVLGDRFHWQKELVNRHLSIKHRKDTIDIVPDGDSDV